MHEKVHNDLRYFLKSLVNCKCDALDKTAITCSYGPLKQDGSRDWKVYDQCATSEKCTLNGIIPMQSSELLRRKSCTKGKLY